MSKRSPFVVVALALLFAGDAQAGNAPGHNNVAALYCRTLGYEVRVVDVPGAGQMGVCVLPDSSSCPEWDFYAGTCGGSFSLCAQLQLEHRNKSDGADTYAPNYTACVLGGVETPVSVMLGFQQRFNTSIGPIDIPTATSPATTPATRAPDPLPSAFTWRNNAGSDWMTSVKDQSQCGSCWAFSAVGATEAVFNIERNDPDLDLDLSEEMLNGGSAGSCCGGWHNNALDIIKNSGIPDEACLPYDVPYYDTGGCDCFGNPPCNATCTGLPAECSQLLPADACADVGSRLTTITNYFSVPNVIDTIKTRLIDEGPLSVCYAHQGTFDGNVYECPASWCRSADGTPSAPCGGAGDPACPSGETCQAVTMNHCVVLAGYDDNNGDGFWILKNSWGAGYDGDGYFNLRYDSCLVQTAVYYVDSGTTPNQAPTAACKAAVKDADGSCCATVNVDDIDDGSDDPDGEDDVATLCITGKDGEEVPCQDSVEICGAGNHTVELTITDEAGESDSCLATVTLQDLLAPTITCPDDVTLECPANVDPSETGVATAIDNCSDPNLTHEDVVTPGCGGTSTLTRTWTAEDASNNTSDCEQAIAVVDTTPPVVDCSVDRETLWPANHKLVDVGFDFSAADACDPDAPTSAIAVTSDEHPATEPGSGGPNHCPDAIVIGDDVSLRSERAGTGDGRVYSIRVTATDACDNAASCSETVGVPKAQGGPHASAVDSGQSADATTCGAASVIREAQPKKLLHPRLDSRRR